MAPVAASTKRKRNKLMVRAFRAKAKAEDLEGSLERTNKKQREYRARLAREDPEGVKERNRNYKRSYLQRPNVIARQFYRKPYVTKVDPAYEHKYGDVTVHPILRGQRIIQCKVEGKCIRLIVRLFQKDNNFIPQMEEGNTYLFKYSMNEICYRVGEDSGDILSIISHINDRSMPLEMLQAAMTQFEQTYRNECRVVPVSFYTHHVSAHVAYSDINFNFVPIGILKTSSLVVVPMAIVDHETDKAHFYLITINNEEKVVQVFDSLDGWPSRDDQEQHIRKVLKIFHYGKSIPLHINYDGDDPFLTALDYKIERPKLPRLENGDSGGIWVFYFAKCKLNKRDILKLSRQQLKDVQEEMVTSLLRTTTVGQYLLNLFVEHSLSATEVASNA